MSKRNFRRKPSEAAALDDAGAGKPKVFVDDDDLLRRPAEPADYSLRLLQPSIAIVPVCFRQHAPTIPLV